MCRATGCLPTGSNWPHAGWSFWSYSDHRLTMPPALAGLVQPLGHCPSEHNTQEMRPLVLQTFALNTLVTPSRQTPVGNLVSFHFFITQHTKHLKTQGLPVRLSSSEYLLTKSSQTPYPGDRHNPVSERELSPRGQPLAQGLAASERQGWGSNPATSIPVHTPHRCAAQPRGPALHTWHTSVLGEPRASPCDSESWSPVPSHAPVSLHPSAGTGEYDPPSPACPLREPSSRWWAPRTAQCHPQTPCLHPGSHAWASWLFQAHAADADVPDLGLHHGLAPCSPVEPF